ncbi:hypothetical protein TNCV_38781 [Trichonephila clavipes]|nr:hypothetical protein TNCV_38781 [Trichonephila clavipes]
MLLKFLEAYLPTAHFLISLPLKSTKSLLLLPSSNRKVVVKNAPTTQRGSGDSFGLKNTRKSSSVAAPLVAVLEIQRSNLLDCAPRLHAFTCSGTPVMILSVPALVATGILKLFLLRVGRCDPSPPNSDKYSHPRSGSSPYSSDSPETQKLRNRRSTFKAVADEKPQPTCAIVLDKRELSSLIRCLEVVGAYSTIQLPQLFHPPSAVIFFMRRAQPNHGTLLARQIQESCRYHIADRQEERNSSRHQRYSSPDRRRSHLTLQECQ